MNDRKKEIRAILNGVYELNENNHIQLGDSITDIQLLNGGLFSSHLFGLTEKRKQFHLKMKENEAKAQCENAFSNMGMRVDLVTAPDAMAVLCCSFMQNPFLMTAELLGRDVLLCFYTAKSLFSFLNAVRGFSRWKKKMKKESFIEMGVTMKPQYIRVTEKKETDGGASRSKKNRTEKK